MLKPISCKYLKIQPINGGAFKGKPDLARKIAS
jgi:hypothetical protein